MNQLKYTSEMITRMVVSKPYLPFAADQICLECCTMAVGVSIAVGWSNQKLMTNICLLLQGLVHLQDEIKDWCTFDLQEGLRHRHLRHEDVQWRWIRAVPSVCLKLMVPVAVHRTNVCA